MLNQLQYVLTKVRESSPILYTISFIFFLLAILCGLGVFIDDRILMGVNVWIKPLKFSISTGIYTLTVGYLITLYPFSDFKKNTINNLTSWTLLIELGIIIYQAARGVSSHYNQSSLMDGLLFAAMGILIGINVLIMVFFIIETIRLKLKTSPSMQWAILIGWLLILTGSWIGGQMIGNLAHNIGVADGGDGLPLLNWSTIGGDLRVAHFFGIHSLQIIPLFAFILQQQWKTTSKNYIIMISVFGVLFAGFIGHTYYQALQGMPFMQG